MIQKYSYDDVCNATMRGFEALYTISRKDIRNKWQKMTRDEKFKAARGLVRLRKIAHAPQEYLSRATTEEAWRTRASEYATKKQLPKVEYAYYFVPTPSTMATKHVQNALNFTYRDGHRYGGGHSAIFYRLADAFMRYDYNITTHSPLTNAHAADVILRAKQLTDRENEIKANWVKGMALHIWHKCK